MFAVGNDWDRAVADPAGLPDQWVVTGNGDNYWGQYTSQTTGAAGTVVYAGDTAQTNDQ